MSVNGINSVSQSYDTTGTTKAKASQAKTVDEAKQKDTESAAVYEKSETDNSATKKVYQRDQNTVDRLLAEAEKRSQSLRDLVSKMLLKQGQAYTESTDIYALLREGKLDIDPETRAQAQKDIAEDGYWGVNETSDRLVSFAMALAGSDPSKAEELIGAVKKGFEEATKTWGADLPEISRRTLDATIKKLEAWRDGTGSGSQMTNASSKALTNQAEVSKLS